MFDEERRELTHLEKEFGKVRKYCHDNGMCYSNDDISESGEVINFIRGLLNLTTQKTKAKICPKCQGEGGWLNFNGHGIEQCEHCNGTGEQ